MCYEPLREGVIQGGSWYGNGIKVTSVMERREYFICWKVSSVFEYEVYY
jgi:hypothetical protein